MERLHESCFQAKKSGAGKKLRLPDLKQLKCALDVLASASGIMTGLDSATPWPYLNWSTLQYVWTLSQGFFFLKFKETISGHQCDPRLPKLLQLMGEAYTLHDPNVCHSQICLWLLVLSLHLTPEANIKCNRSQTYLDKPTQKSEGYPAESATGSHGLPSGKETKEVAFPLQFLKNQKTDHTWTPGLSK